MIKIHTAFMKKLYKFFDLQKIIGNSILYLTNLNCWVYSLRYLFRRGVQIQGIIQIVIFVCRATVYIVRPGIKIGHNLKTI